MRYTEHFYGLREPYWIFDVGGYRYGVNLDHIFWNNGILIARFERGQEELFEEYSILRWVKAVMIDYSERWGIENTISGFNIPLRLEVPDNDEMGYMGWMRYEYKIPKGKEYIDSLLIMRREIGSEFYDVSNVDMYEFKRELEKLIKIIDEDGFERYFPYNRDKDIYEITKKEDILDRFGYILHPTALMLNERLEIRNFTFAENLYTFYPNIERALRSARRVANELGLSEYELENKKKEVIEYFKNKGFLFKNVTV